MIAVLEIGGTHVSAAIVDPTTWQLVGAAQRLHLAADGDAELLLSTFAAAAALIACPAGASWGIAMPDPFDYAHGIALFEGVGKFEALYGVDVGAELRSRLGAATVTFVNDADAFTLGEWLSGAARGSHRCVGLTLGTGVGSGWIADGEIVSDGPGIPPGGRAHRLDFDRAPLEDTMSRRAIRAAYLAAGGDHGADHEAGGGPPDVREIAERARAGEATATAVLSHAVGAVGAALAPGVREFGADVLVVGGSMAASWELFEPWFRAGAAGELPPVRVAENAENAGLLGAAYVAAT